jgi:uncharacterized protein YndB with AHSA1/START domain/predicted enzyme related to lactoylglutathione lyase
MRSTIYFLFLALLPIFSKAQDALTWSDQVITKSFHCNQSLDSLWWRWTTHEGLKTFFGADNKVDLKPGGAYEIYFLTDKPKGSQGTEGCTLLSILPKRMLSFSWIAPPSFPDLRKHPHKTWVVVELQPVAVNETNIIITHLGFPKGEEWKPLYEYFNGAWNYVVQNLKKLDGLPTKSTDKKSVQGIGGIFFKSKNPKELKQWYHDHLGMTIDGYGTSFEWRLSDDPSKKGLTQWSPFKETTDYFLPSTKDFMINYRVNDLEGLLEELKKAQVTICDSLEVYDYGKFIHILDPEGNKIELWEALETEKK